MRIPCQPAAGRPHLADPVETLRGALTLVEGVEVAFVFGSFARDDAMPHSDIDVVVIGEGLA